MYYWVQNCFPTKRTPKQTQLPKSKKRLLSQIFDPRARVIANNLLGLISRSEPHPLRRGLCLNSTPSGHLRFILRSERRCAGRGRGSRVFRGDQKEPMSRLAHRWSEKKTWRPKYPDCGRRRHFVLHSAWLFILTRHPQTKTMIHLACICFLGVNYRYVQVRKDQRYRFENINCIALCVQPNPTL